jgi:hypothetical protein
VKDYIPWLVIGVLGAIVIVLTQYLAAQRRKQFKEEASRLGLRYAPGSGAIRIGDMKHPLFELGHGHELSNVLDGAFGGVNARVFEYQYSTGSGKNRSTYVQTVAAFQTGEPLPAFEMFPERFYHRFAELLGSKDIDFAWNPAFSAEYRLLGRDAEAVRALFNSPISTALAENPGWTVEGVGRSLIVYRSHERIQPRGLETFLKQTVEIARAFGPV